MFEIEGNIVNSEILTVKFCCDIAACKGICCVEGNAGAPLNEDELETIESEYKNYREFMTGEGIEVIENEGFYTIDEDGDYTTPLINDAQCAYAFSENGVTMCAMERAYLNGKSPYIKPISCHLYPIRITKFSNGTLGLNYHRWGVCSSALKNGAKIGLPMYKMLKTPIIRQFGESFYAALEDAENYINSQK
ncbi:MAG: DUF3109 family protein [Rikenellaceae bacterium]